MLPTVSPQDSRRRRLFTEMAWVYQSEVLVDFFNVVTLFVKVDSFLVGINSFSAGVFLLLLSIPSTVCTTNTCPWLAPSKYFLKKQMDG